MRRLVLLLVAAAAIAAPPATAADNPLADAVAKTTAQPSFRFAFTGEVVVPGSPLRFTAAGATDNAAGKTAMRMDLSKVATLLGPLAGKPSDWRVDAVLDGRAYVMYMRFPFLTRVYRTQKPWVRVDLATAGTISGLDVGQFTQADPLQQLGLLRATTGEVQKIGTQTVRGEETTHYRGTVDYARYAKIAPAKQRPALRRLVRQLRSTAVPVDVWVDRDGLLRRMALAVVLKQGSTNVSLDIFDYGAKVRAVPPPAAQTADLNELAKKRKGS